MKKKLLNLLLVGLLLLVIPGTLVLASDIAGALYRMGITVSNNGTLANYVSTTGNISTDNLISGCFTNAAVDNVAVQAPGGSDVIFMPGYTTNPWCFWVETIGADSYVNYNLYTAESTNGTIAYFPDTTGMIVSDNATLELGNDFEVDTYGWVDTVVSANKSLVYKEDAFRTYISANSSITSGIYSYPIVLGVVGGNDVANGVNHTVNLPADIESGDLLLSFFASDGPGGPVVITYPGGWVELFSDQQAAGNVEFGAWYKIAAGTEGATINVTTDGAQMTAHTTYRITSYTGVPEVGAHTDGNSANPDPPNLAPSWGAEDTLWFTSCGYNIGTTTVTAYSANYTDGRNDRANHAEGVGLGVATRELNAVAENPGAFTISGAQEWVANTVAIQPGWSDARNVTATGIASGEYTVKTYGVDNEPTWATGDVLHFTGANNSNVNAGAIHNAEAKLWASFWFKLDSTFTVASPTQSLFGKWITDNDYISVYLNTGSGNLIWRQLSGGGARFTLLSTKSVWAADTWFHIIVSMSDTGPAQRMIIDNSADATDNQVAFNTPNGGDVILGNFKDAAAGGHIGEIQNVIMGTDDLTLKMTGTNTDLIATNLVIQDVTGATGYVTAADATSITVARTNAIAFVAGQDVKEVGDATDLLTSVVLSTDEEANLYAGTAPADAVNYWYIDEGTGTGVGALVDYGTGGNDGDVDAACTWETATFTTGSTGRWCDFYIEVDDGVTDPDRWGANLKTATVPPNTNDWEFFLNDAMAYVYTANVTVGGVPVSAWEWEYDAIFYDLIGVNDATPSFRTTSSDADIIATAVSFVPIEEAKAPAWTLEAVVATWITAPNITGNFTTTPGPTYPGASVITDIATASGTPAQLPFTVITGFLILAASLCISYAMRQYGSSGGGLLVKTLVISVLMWIGVALDVIDYWMLLFFIIPALAIMAANKQGALI